jgi:hypothetical protein
VRKNSSRQLDLDMKEVRSLNGVNLCFEEKISRTELVWARIKEGRSHIEIWEC